ncbi:MAG: hypothetical protein JW751_16625 [Polyangiaceae bacterium]|nr:hypothetical protein [Polyangiaceae bacterium]
MRQAILLALCLAPLACGNKPPATAYLHEPTQGHASSLARDMDVDDLEDGSKSLKPGAMRLRPDVCAEVPLTPAYERISANALGGFLGDHGFEFKTEAARHDLVYFDVKLPGSTMRLRVATLGSAPEAARDLHEALLEHGRGSWGVHRSNIAVLAPIGSPSQIVEVAVATKLACWGVLTVAGRDDVFVVPGGYAEL